MARIDEYLRKILSSRYGKDVRDAIHDSIEEINNINEANISTVQAIANTAQGYANNASNSADTAQAQATLAETAKTNAETAEDGAEHFYQETLAIAQSLGSALIPKGTVEFANLPSVSSSAVKDGFMWNISDPFTTTNDFVEGAGLSIPMGANVYKVTINNVPKWDILAGSSAQVFTGTEAQIAQAIQQGLLGEGVMINSLDDGDDELLTTSMISHDGDSLENKLDDIDDSISQLNSDIGNVFNAEYIHGERLSVDANQSIQSYTQKLIGVFNLDGTDYGDSSTTVDVLILRSNFVDGSYNNGLILGLITSSNNATVYGMRGKAIIRSVFQNTYMGWKSLT